MLNSRNRNFFKGLPKSYQVLSRHWSDEEACLLAASFLIQGSNRILDVGSGVGSFCVIAGASYPEAQFVGVEIRNELFLQAQTQAELFQLSNCSFLNQDIREIDFSQYDGFYFFNSFLELLDPTCIIDDGSHVNWKEYLALTEFLFQSLNEMPIGTRLATYDVSPIGIPHSYRLIGSELNGLLRFYCKYESDIHDEKLDIDALQKYMHSIQ
jgi:SAM-dependent methyltransferase